MANIIELIKNIRNAIYGKYVRESIASAIEQTYEDASKSGNANMEVSEARGEFDTLSKRLNNSDSVKADKTITNNLQSQINSNANAINVEKARIDNLASLPERKYNRRCRTYRYESSEQMELYMTVQEKL